VHGHALQLCPQSTMNSSVRQQCDEMIMTMSVTVKFVNDICTVSHAARNRGGATPGPGRSYALPLKNWDLALGPACDKA